MKKVLINSSSQLEKPEEMHLVELNPDSIWIKVDKFVLGKFAPDPDYMRNYCPFIWLTVCAFIILVPVAIVKFFWLILRGIGFIFEHLVLIPAEKAFLKAFEIDPDVRLDVLSENDFEEYGSWHRNLPWYVKRDHYSEAYERWIEEQILSRKMTRRQILAEFIKLHEERIELEKKRKAHQQMSWKMPKATFIDKWADSIQNSFDDFMEKTRDVVQAQKMLIKATQRFIGLLVTIVIAAALYFVLNFISRGIIWLVNVWDWTVILTGLKFIGVAAAIVLGVILIILLAGKLFEWLKEVVPANNFVFRGVKLLIVTPLYFLFVVFLWKIVCVAFFWKILIKLIIVGFVLFIIRGILGVGPLFKSYFGQEYSVLCPGIKWVKK